MAEYSMSTERSHFKEPSLQGGGRERDVFDLGCGGLTACR